jgi:hypothetical protein
MATPSAIKHWMVDENFRRILRKHYVKKDKIEVITSQGFVSGEHDHHLQGVEIRLLIRSQRSVSVS